ncbi:uncharacterized protein LOC117610014 [Osmia lignaria lignaria]|uniref:uncharacterized protein LOC117610014 n=1 Tax=Osmia lignaria lignaria TaxID=1437193 RepID=UPI0014790ADA|nr:uncharacterized protein LOC117610014 [Osmia lignaria]
MGVEEATTKKISGDGLSLKLHSNKQILEITGDGCNISVNKNSGSVKIIGDGCRLRIDENTGEVEYTGDGGRVLLGAKSIKDKVKYTGDGGRITFDGESRTKGRKFEQPFDKFDKMDGGKEGCPKGAEEMENVLNAEKEAKGKEKKRARIVTTFQFDEKLIEKWFASPNQVVKSFDGASFVKVVPKQRKTTIEVK